MFIGKRDLKIKAIQVLFNNAGFFWTILRGLQRRDI